MPLLKLNHVGKEKLKLNFDITIQKVTHLSELNNRNVFIAWKRGSRKNSGRLRDVVVANNEAVWNEKISLKSTLFRDQDTGKFSEKTFSIHLKLNDDTTLGKMEIDLGHYSKHDSMSVLENSFSNKDRNSPILHVAIQCRWLKLNDKVLVRNPSIVPEENAPGTAPGHTPMVEIEGHSYSLQTADAPNTETSVDSTEKTGSFEEETGEKDDPFVSSGIYEAEVKRAHEDADSLRKQLRLVEGESAQRGKTIELQEKELLSLRQQLESMESKCVENEELIQRAYGLEAFMQQQLALARQGYEDAVKALKSEIAELEKKNAHRSSYVSEEEDVYEVPQGEVAKRQDSVIIPRTYVFEKDQLSLEDPDASPRPCGADIERLVSERDELMKRVEALHVELDKSAKSFVSITTQLGDKDKRIHALVLENKTLQLQYEQTLQGPTSEEEDGGEVTIVARRTTQPVVAVVPLPPLFANRLIDRQHPYLVVFVFLIILSLLAIIF